MDAHIEGVRVAETPGGLAAVVTLDVRLHTLSNASSGKSPSFGGTSLGGHPHGFTRAIVLPV